MPRVNEQIRRARRASGLTQEALAERIGVTPADVYRYEEGAEVSSRQLERIAVATGRPVSFFVGGPESRNGRRIGGWVHAAFAWLSEAAGADTEVDALLAEIAARERALTERERRIAERERRLQASRSTTPAPPDLANVEAELEEKARALEQRAAELARTEQEIAERKRAAQAALQARTEKPEAAQPAVAGFNLDALEHRLDERAGEFPDRAEEWRAYILFLREFVHADGDLPPTFNTLVREVFRELLA